MVKAGEQTLGNGIIMPFAMPLRNPPSCVGVLGAGVAAADVNAKGDPGETLDHRIVGVDGALQVLVGVLIAGAHGL